MAVDAGLPGIYFVGDIHGTWTEEADQSIDAGVWDPAPPPRGHEWERIFPGVPLREDPRAFPYDTTFADWLLSGRTTGIRQHPCVVPGFDNTPRSGWRGILLHGLDPSVFEAAVREAVRRERAMPGPRMMFIKSWNEWAEGAIMEPDQVFGRAFLRALDRGLSSLPVPQARALARQCLRIATCQPLKSTSYWPSMRARKASIEDLTASPESTGSVVFP